MTDRTELLEAGLDSLTEGVALANHEGRVVLWNLAAGVITGFAGAQTVGHSVREMLDLLVVDRRVALDEANRRGERTGARMAGADAAQGGS